MTWIEPKTFDTSAELMAHYAAMKKRKPKAWIAPPVVIVAPTVVLPVVVYEVKNIELSEAHAILDRGPGAARILKAISFVSGVPIEQIKGPRRVPKVVKARMVFYHLCRKHTSLSYPAIGRWVGGKDHSTVLHGVRKIELHYAAFEKMINGVEHLLFGLTPSIEKTPGD